MENGTCTVPAGSLVYGMQLPIQSVSRSFSERWEVDADDGDLARIAVHADELGFFYVAVCDHVGIPFGDPAANMRTTWYDTVATLGYLAGITTRVRLMSSVYIVAYRHPLLTAKAFMTLDRLSGGRVILGVGAGHLRDEFDVLGVPFDERGAITDDAVDLIRAAFAEEFPRHDGPYFRSGELGLAPRPAQRAIPIWIGGRAPAALRRVARRGDGWIPQGSARAEMATDIAYIHAERERAGRDAPIDLGFVTEDLYVGTPSWDVSDRATIHGSGELIAEKMLEMKALGVNHLQVRFRSRSIEEHLDQMSAWTHEVAPLLG